MSMNDDHFLFCHRVEDLDHPITGAVVELCSRCGASVWVSPSSRRMRKETGLKLSPVCNRCVPVAIVELPPDEKIEVQKLTMDQIEELAAEVKRRRGSE